MNTLLDPVLAKRLSNFKISTNRIVRGGHKGERRSHRLGSSLEFSDYRLYSPGDDLRQIDWNTYARTQKYYIKRFLDEQELTVSVYLDCTKSMGIKEEKWHRAKELTAVFAFLTLANADRLRVIPVASPSRPYPFTKGKAMTNKMMEYIQHVELSEDNEAFGTRLNQIAHQGRKGTLTLVISDFLDDPTELFSAMKKMHGNRQRVLLIQVLLPEEKAPEYGGDLKLVDIESGSEEEVSMNQRVMKNYQQLLDNHTNKLKAFCHRREGDLIQCLTSTSLEKTIFSSIMGKGLIGR